MVYFSEDDCTFLYYGLKVVHQIQVVFPQGSQRPQRWLGIEKICNKERGSQRVVCHITVLGIHVLSHYCTEEPPATHCFLCYNNSFGMKVLSNV